MKSILGNDSYVIPAFAQSQAWRAGRRAILTHDENSATALWILIINSICLAVILGLTVYYVMQANIITANNYSIKILQDRLSTAQEINSSLAVERSHSDDAAVLNAFAKAHGMVPAGPSAIVYEISGVAVK